MVELQSVISVISVVIAIGSLFTAIIVMSRNKIKDEKNETKENVEIHAELQSQINMVNHTTITRLDGIDNGIRDIKADYRGIRTEIRDLRDEFRAELRDTNKEASEALHLAQAAHRRLDRAGIEKDTEGDYNEHQGTS